MKSEFFQDIFLSAYKEFYRRRFRDVLSSMSPQERRLKNKKRFSILKRHPWIQKSSCLFTYMNRIEEPETESLIRWALRQKKKVILPRVNLETNEIELFQIHNLKKDLKSGFLKIKEPDPRRCVPAKADEIELWIVPGLAFGPKGERLGRGRGFFDRLLAGVRKGRTLGLAFSDQMFSQIPCAKHDQRVHAVVTNEKVFKGCK